MNGVAVVTDSVASLPQDLLEQHGIHSIPVRLTVEGRIYQDTNEDLPRELVRKFQELPRIDTTPWPPESYFKVYRELSERAGSIVHVVCFSQFTSTISLAMAGARMVQEAMPHLRVEVLDSETVAMGQGFVALAAARAAACGKSLDEVIEAANAAKSSVNSLFVFDSLRCLRRTGRIDKLAAWASSLLNVKPIVRLSQGKARPVSMARSKPQGAQNVIRIMDAAVDRGEPLHVAVMEAECRSEAEQLLEMVRRQFQPAELHLVQFTPAMQVVAGSGILGVAFYTGD